MTTQSTITPSIGFLQISNPLDTIDNNGNIHRVCGNTNCPTKILTSISSITTCECYGKNEDPFLTDDLGGFHKKLPLLKRGDNPEDLDILYVGTDIDGVRWDLVVMAPPQIESLGGIEITDETRHRMQTSANFGYVLKIGKRAFEEERDGAIVRPDLEEFKLGQLVHFDEYHSQPLRLNGLMIYFISDVRTVCNAGDPLTHQPHLLSMKGLQGCREKALKWRNMTIQERINSPYYFN